MSEALSASLEDYLEAILSLLEGDGEAHVRDIAERLGVTMPSVTGALHALAERKLVNYQPYSTATLTGQGRRIAEGVSHRHQVFATFFGGVLGLKVGTAEENACRLEHAIDDEVLERLADYIAFVHQCPLGTCRWEGGFGRFCEQGGTVDDCEERLEQALADCRARKTEGGPSVAAVTLDQVRPGQTARIVKVRVASGSTNKRIVDMGVIPGTLVEVERVAPLGDPIEVKVKGYHLSLRKEEAKGITVEPVAEAR